MNPPDPQPKTEPIILIKSPNGGYIVANQVQAGQPGQPAVGNDGLSTEKAAHPNICILHMLFKVVTVLLYFLGSVISSSSLTSGLLIIVFAAFDFWIVKNISGRLLY